MVHRQSNTSQLKLILKYAANLRAAQNKNPRYNNLMAALMIEAKRRSFLGGL